MDTAFLKHCRPWPFPVFYLGTAHPQQFLPPDPVLPRSPSKAASVPSHSGRPSAVPAMTGPLLVKAACKFHPQLACACIQKEPVSFSVLLVMLDILVGNQEPGQCIQQTQGHSATSHQLMFLDQRVPWDCVSISG